MTDDETSPPPRPIFRFRDTVAIKLEEADPATESSTPGGVTAHSGDGHSASAGLIARASDQEWSASALLFLLDVVGWFADLRLYQSCPGRSRIIPRPLSFLVIDLLQATVIVMALFTVGGYDRSTETRSLVYATEHLLAIIVAAVISVALIYSAATYDQTMKPSRSVVLVSFIIFLPVSLEYRRWLRGRVIATIAERAFLVIGSGELAQRFYEAYRKSPNHQRLEFVDVRPERVGDHIAGPGSPLIERRYRDEAEPAADRNYSGVILADRVDRIPPELVERLVRTQFQKTRVYTIESFYESQWRYVPVDAIDPVWPLQTGFQLARNSPYHYLKRLCDLVARGRVIGYLFLRYWCSSRRSIWLESGSPDPLSADAGGAGREGVHSLQAAHDDNETSGVGRDDIYTRQNDPRITRVGRWLRKLRLDELPQLWNVFSGEMSLIGPRAEWTKCAERYETQIPFYHFRHLVKPGITGWAQVNYPYGESEQDAIEKLKYDLYYIRRYSLKLDAMIALKTVHVMLFSRGRYRRPRLKSIGYWLFGISYWGAERSSAVICYLLLKGAAGAPRLFVLGRIRRKNLHR